MPLQSDTPKNDRPRLPIGIRKKLRRVRRTTELKGNGHGVVAAKRVA
jgi:hypothetical protein